MIKTTCRPNVKLFNKLFGKLIHLGIIQRNSFAKPLFAMALEHRIFGYREGQHQAPALTIRRDCCYRMVNNIARRCGLYFFTADGNGTRLGFHQSIYGIGKLTLTVAVNTGKTHNLTGANFQIKAVDLLDTTFILYMKIPDGKQYLSRLCGLLVNVQINIAANHLIRQFRFISL